MPLLFRTHYKLARASIKANRTRSFLTCLGIAIGVASIILIFSLMGSISNLVQTETSALGDELIVVRPNSDKSTITNIIEEFTTANAFQNSSLNLTDIQTISNINNITAVAPISISTNTVSSDKNTFTSVAILGTNSDFIKIEPLTMRFGSFLTDQTTTEKSEKTEKSSSITARPVVLGRTLSLSLFNTISSTVGQTITILGEKFMIVGVLDEVNKSINFNNVDFDNAVIMNAKDLNEITGGIQIQQINIKATNTAVLPEVSAEIKSALSAKKSGDQNFSVAYGDDILHPSSTLFSVVSGILTLVGSISLLVGGIGIMNIMLVSVSERTHEIGVRKAVGASSKNILMQFLLESLLLSFSGSLLGLLLAYFLAFIISSFTPFAPFISWEIILITFCTALVIGIVFGMYPAIKASAKNPIDSLKHYR